MCLNVVAKSMSHLNLKVGWNLLFILSQMSVTRIQITSKSETVQDCACRRTNCWQATKKVILHNNLNAHHDSEHKEFKTNSFGVGCRSLANCREKSYYNSTALYAISIFHSKLASRQ